MDMCLSQKARNVSSNPSPCLIFVELMSRKGGKFVGNVQRVLFRLSVFIYIWSTLNIKT